MLLFLNYPFEYQDKKKKYKKPQSDSILSVLNGPSAGISFFVIHFIDVFQKVCFNLYYIGVLQTKQKQNSRF